MPYSTDKQTQDDLNLTGRYKQNSIFALYNKTKTKRAANFLENIFSEPMIDAQSINNRRDVICSLGKFKGDFILTNDLMESVYEYLNTTSSRHYVFALFDTFQTKFSSLIFSKDDFLTLQSGVRNTNILLKRTKVFASQLLPLMHGTEFESKIKFILELFDEDTISNLEKQDFDMENSVFKLALFNQLIRKVYVDKIRQIMHILEQIDCYMSIAKIGQENNFVYADALIQEQTIIDIKNVRHPIVKGCIGNDIFMSESQNLIFLTGANMAGKSTLMKSLGISLYLAQLGFPIPADYMKFTPIEGMYTSINVPDDISQGYSHFYAEVMRVKSVAIEVANKKKLLVIFDELFKGTNVKDAYDGTLTLTKLFAKCSKSVFIISTHIMEAGELLKSECRNIQFKHLPTLLVDDVPKYTYKLSDGIADDRHGMRIINNEKIIDIIRESI